MRKLYYTFNQLRKDLPSLRDTEINIVDDFDKTIKNIKTREYQSVKAQLKRQNILPILLRPLFLPPYYGITPRLSFSRFHAGKLLRFVLGIAVVFDRVANLFHHFIIKIQIMQYA